MSLHQAALFLSTYVYTLRPARTIPKSLGRLGHLIFSGGSIQVYSSRTLKHAFDRDQYATDYLCDNF